MNIKNTRGQTNPAHWFPFPIRYELHHPHIQADIANRIWIGTLRILVIHWRLEPRCIPKRHPSRYWTGWRLLNLGSRARTDVSTWYCRNPTYAGEKKIHRSEELFCFTMHIVAEPLKNIESAATPTFRGEKLISETMSPDNVSLEWTCWNWDVNEVWKMGWALAGQWSRLSLHCISKGEAPRSAAQLRNYIYALVVYKSKRTSFYIVIILANIYAHISAQHLSIYLSTAFSLLFLSL